MRWCGATSGASTGADGSTFVSVLVQLLSVNLDMVRFLAVAVFFNTLKILCEIATRALLWLVWCISWFVIVGPNDDVSVCCPVLPFAIVLGNEMLYVDASFIPVCDDTCCDLATDVSSVGMTSDLSMST